MVEDNAVSIHFILVKLIVLLTLIIVWHYQTLYCLAIDRANLIVVEAYQLPDATTVASLAIVQSCAKVTLMPKTPRLEVRVMAKAIDLKAMVVAVVRVIGRERLGSCHGCP